MLTKPEKNTTRPEYTNMITKQMFSKKAMKIFVLIQSVCSVDYIITSVSCDTADSHQKMNIVTTGLTTQI